MSRLMLILACLLLANSAPAADSYTSRGLKDVWFGEALYYAYQGEWFDAVARLDTELGQHRRLDEPGLDTLHYHIDQAEFGVGDFELGYRMHLRAGRAITAVIEGNVEEQVRNEAIYRLARLYFRKDRPENALQTLERIRGEVPAAIRDDVEFLRGEILMANGRFPEAAALFKELKGGGGLEGFAGYNLGIALIRDGKEEEGRRYLDRTGLITGDSPAVSAIRDKSNLVLGYKLLEKNSGDAKPVLDRVRLSGPFSNRALLGSGWADASQGLYERALVPWSILAERQVTDAAVQEALLAVPYAYGKLNIHGKAAVLYGKALDSFGSEVDRLGASIASVREGKFLQALAREELKQDSDWVVKLRSLPEAPETYYLLELMASHDFQESLRNYLDLKELQKRLTAWEGDLDAFEEIIRLRRAYYQPLLPEIDKAFGQLDSQIRLRMEQRDRVEKRLHLLLTAPRPDSLATAEERIAGEQIAALERGVAGQGGGAPEALKDRIARLRGVLRWNIDTQYDRRLTEAYSDLRDLNEAVDMMKKRYAAFVRTRQAATLSCEGYDETIARQRTLIAAALGKLKEPMARQGTILEAMAVEELTKRRERLENFKITARFAIADSYDRAARAQAEKTVEQAGKDAASPAKKKDDPAEKGTVSEAEKNVGNQAEQGVAPPAEKPVGKQPEKGVGQ